MNKRPYFTDAAILVTQKEKLIVDKIELPRELSRTKSLFRFLLVVYVVHKLEKLRV